MSDIAAGKPHPEVPWDKIREIITNVGPETEIALRVQRRQPNGELATESGKRLVSAATLLDIEEWLMTRGGGGKYEIWVRAVDSMEKLINFNVVLNAQMTRWSDPEWDARREEHKRDDFVKKIETLKSTAMKYPLPARFAGMHPEQIPPHPRADGWIKGLPSIEQWQLLPDIDSPVAYPTAPSLTAPGAGLPAHPAYGPQVQLPPGASMTSDAIAMKQADDERKEKQRLATENARLQEQLNATKTLHAQELKALEDRINNVERDAQQRIHTTEVQTLERKFEAMIAAMQQPKKGPLDNIDAVALLTAAAPIITALIARPKPDPMQQIAPLLAIMAPKGDSSVDLLLKLAPIAAPLAMKYMEGKGPAAQAELFDTLFDAQQRNVALSAQIMQSMAQQSGGDSPWVGLVQSLLAGGGEMLAQFLEERKQKGQPQQPPRMAHRQPQQLPPTQQQAPAQAPPGQPQQAAPSNGGPTRAGYTTIDDAPVQTNGKADDAHPSEVVPTSEAVHAQDASADQRPPPSAEEVVELFMSHPSVPPAFKSMPWKSIIFRMHTGEAEDGPEEVAADLLELLERTEKRSTLPPLLAAWRTAPLATFSQLVRFLPVQEFNPEYAEALVQSLVKLIEEPEDEEADDGAPEVSADMRG